MPRLRLSFSAAENTTKTRITSAVNCALQLCLRSLQSGFFSSFGNRPDVSTHGGLIARQICIAGLSQEESSSAPALKTTIASLDYSWVRIGEPYSGQNLRLSCLKLSAVTVKPFNSPVIETVSIGTPTVVGYAPPAAYWQSLQWQWSKRSVYQYIHDEHYFNDTHL